MAVNLHVTMPHADPGKAIRARVYELLADGRPNLTEVKREYVVAKEGDSASAVLHSGEAVVFTEIAAPADPAA